MEKTMDRRTARTRAALFDALVALLLRMDYESITVQDILDEANIGRSTFYAHYTGKEDLLRGAFEKLRALLVDEQRKALARQGGSQERTFGFSLAMFEHVRSHMNLYKALVGGRGATIALNEVRRLLMDLVREEMREWHSEEGMPRDLVAHYVVGAFMAVLTWWLDRKAVLPPAQIDASFRRLAIGGLGTLGEPAV